MPSDKRNLAALRKMLEERDAQDSPSLTVGEPRIKRVVSGDGGVVESFTPEEMAAEDAKAKVSMTVGEPHIDDRLSDLTPEEAASLKTPERLALEADPGSVSRRLKASLAQLDSIPEDLQKPFGQAVPSGPEYRPDALKKNRIEVGSSAKVASPRPFQSIAGPGPASEKLTPEQMDSVVKFAAERAKPQDSGVAAAPEVSPEEKMRLALEAARKQANRDEGMAMMQRAGANLGGAISGVPVDQSFYDRLDASARRPVGDLEKDQGIQRAGAKDKAAEAAAVREWTLKKLGLEGANADRKGDNDRADKALAETARHNRAEEGISGRKAKGAGGGEHEIAPGYFSSGDIKISPTEAGGFRNAAAIHDDFVRNLGELRKLHSAKGTELGGKDASRMASLATKMKLQIKDMAKLGAISGSDAKMLDDLVPDPSSLGANVASALTMGFSDNTDSKLDELQGQADSTLSTQARSLGLQHRGGQATAPVAPFKGGKRIRAANGKTGWWDGVSPLPPGVEVVDG